MDRIDELLMEYGESHRNPTNKLIHWICVPLIALSTVGLLWAIPSSFGSPWINYGTILLGLALVYYLSLSRVLFVSMVIFSAALAAGVYGLSQWAVLPLWASSAIIFFISWAVQVYGHKIEGKKPSFIKDIQFLLIGPAWLASFILRRMGIAYSAGSRLNVSSSSAGAEA